MNLLADESVDLPIITRLRADGLEVLSIAEVAPSITDDVVLDRANQQGALLLTADKDFGELVFRQRRITQGVVLIRLAGLSAAEKAEVVSTAIRNYTSELQDAFMAISPGMVRIRPQTV